MISFHHEARDNEALEHNALTREVAGLVPATVRQALRRMPRVAVAAGVLLGMTAQGVQAGSTTTLPPTCNATPLTNCRVNTSDKAAFQVKLDSAKPHKNKLKFSWNNGEKVAMDLKGTGEDEFLNPAYGVPTMALCLYDGNTLVSSSEVFSGGTCANGKPCWKVAGSGRAYNYKDKDATPGGITKIKLQGGDDGKARVIVDGKGILLDMPPLPVQDYLVAQFVIDEFPAVSCFSTTFTGEGFNKNTDSQFKAKGPEQPAQ